MSTKIMLYDHLKENGVFNRQIHPLVTRATQCIAGEIPERLKLSIALSELITLTSHLRKPIQLHDGTIVPCNAITFSLAGSGVSKDSSMNQVRKALSTGYASLEQYRKDLAKHNAEKAAILEGKPEDWMNYYNKPRDLQAGLGTVEGIIQHFADISDGEVGAGFISTSEIGTELLTNSNITDIVKTISIAYDLGKIPAKIIKSSEKQTPSIDGLPISALFFGSQDAILYDNSIKTKFRTMFGVQLARRSIFAFSPETVSAPDFKSPQELSRYRSLERETTVKAQEELLALVENIVANTNTEPLLLSEEAQFLFDVYKEYNRLEADDMEARYPINKLSRRHKQWLALKLSGNYAILDGNNNVTEDNYVKAINTIELFANDLMNFEKELVKEPYEIFTEFCKHNAEKGKYTIGLHALRKLGYIPTSGSAKAKIEELVHLASSYDQDAIYTACEDGVCYEEQLKTDIAGVSYLEVSGTKKERSNQCAEGFEFGETSFEELAGLLANDYAYNPFQFKNGKRSKNNIVGGCSFIALDIDKSIITDEECHLMLEGINHHIARTSDKNNQFKFRVLIELDSLVDIEDKQWRYFIESIAKELGLQVDVLPKSQIYFAYEGREVLSELEGEPLVTRKHIMRASEVVTNKPTPKKLSTAQQKAMLDDKLETFNRAFTCESGSGSREMITAVLYAKDLGCDETYAINLVDSISEYWLVPMPPERLENIHTQISRMF